MLLYAVFLALVADLILDLQENWRVAVVEARLVAPEGIAGGGGSGREGEIRAVRVRGGWGVCGETRGGLYPT